MSTNTPKESKSELAKAPQTREGMYELQTCDEKKPICGPCRTHPKDEQCQYADGLGILRAMVMEDTVSLLEAQLLELERPAPFEKLYHPYQSPRSLSPFSPTLTTSSLPSGSHRETSMAIETNTQLEGPWIGFLGIEEPSGHLRAFFEGYSSSPNAEPFEFSLHYPNQRTEPHISTLVEAHRIAGSHDTSVTTHVVQHPATIAEDVLNPMYPHARSLRSLLAPRPFYEYDVEMAMYILQGSHEGQPPEASNASVQGVRRSDHLNDVPILRILPTATAATTLVPDRTDQQPYCQSSSPVNRSGISDYGYPVMTSAPPSSEEPIVTDTLPPWYTRVFASLTMFSELSGGEIPEDFARVHTRLQREWVFDGSFLLALTTVNAAMFAINPNSLFEVNPYAHCAVATSSAACGLGVGCDVWFLVRYNWVDSEVFTHRSRDVYGSYVFFSLSSRVPTCCVLVASTSLTAFMGLIAYDADPVVVRVIAVLVVLVMILQFLVYGAHRVVMSALPLWRAVAVSVVNASRGFRGLAGRG